MSIEREMPSIEKKRKRKSKEGHAPSQALYKILSEARSDEQPRITENA